MSACVVTMTTMKIDYDNALDAIKMTSYRIYGWSLNGRTSWPSAGARERLAVATGPTCGR